jgi:tRNA(Ile)-lysidine synthase
MIKMYGDVPMEVAIACSGGVDSMVISDFLKRGRRKVSWVFFDHGTETSRIALEFLREQSVSMNISLTVGEKDRERGEDESPEEYWRNMRYSFFQKLQFDIISAHHLGDVMETYVFNMLHGKKGLIPYRNRNVYRPFLFTRKIAIQQWAEQKGVPYVIDSSNYDMRYMRNRIRHEVMPKLLAVNPGFDKVVERELRRQIENPIFDSNQDLS